MGEYTDRLTYGVDLDGGPDRPIHDLVHGVCPLPNLRPAELALFILCMVPDAAGRMAPPPVACWTGQQLRRAWWSARPTPLDRSVVPFPGRISCETSATKGADARSLNLLRY